MLDFGLCYSFRNGRENLCCDFAGSREYAPPEIILTSSSFSSIKADVWSLGVTIYALLFGCFPFGFDSKSAEQMMISGRHPEVTFPAHVNVCSEAVDLVKKMLEVNPEKRIDVQSMRLHPWFDF